jgi:nucleoside-diphosphate-sugar epimerase
MRCAIENKDIVLKTQGLTERCYLYTADAVSAILTALLKAEPGNAYTVANPSTYCSIKDMAAMVSRDIAQDKISVVYDVVDDIGRFGYAETLYMDLNVDKLMSLGWKPTTDLENMFRRMIRGLQ